MGMYSLLKKTKECFKSVILFFQVVIFCPPLKSVAIEINSACNRKCPFCPNMSHHRDPEFLQEELVNKVIGELKKMKFKGELCFHLYNEPLLDIRLPKFIAYARKCLPLAYIYINTNGDLLNLSMWENLRKQGLDFALVTQYDGKVSDNILNILDHLQEAEKKHFCCRIFTPETANNRAGLVNKSIPVQLPLNKYCPRPAYQLCINYRGKAIICCNDYLGLVETGDIRKDAIEDIWRNKIFRHYRRTLYFGNRKLLMLCDNCDA